MASYAVLGIASDATDDEVRLAYKHKALECHPDRHAKDKDLATRNFIELNTAYRSIVRQRERKAAASQSSKPPDKPAEQQKRAPPKESTPPKPPSSGSSTRSFKSTCSSTASTPSSSPFTTPSSSPYSTPASTPASSTTSLPEEKSASSTPKASAACDDVEDEEDDCSSTAGSSTTSHTAKPPDPSSPGSVPASPKSPRAKLRKQPKPKTSSSSGIGSGSSSNSPHDYKYHDSQSEPTYAASPSDTASRRSPTDTRSEAGSDTSSKHSTKPSEIELKEYYNSLPSLKDYPRVDLAPEWVCPLPVALEDLFRGKRICFRIKRRYLSGKTKSVVLDVDVPVGCRAGTKIVFRDAGHERRDGTKQDLVFVVTEVRHERFVRGYEWDGGGGHGRDRERNSENPKERPRDKDKDKRDGDRDKGTTGAKPRKSREYGEDDLVMEVRLPWVDRLKDEKAKVVISGVDGEDIVFEVDCRGGKGGGSRDRDREKGKVTGVYIIEGAGMPVRSDVRSASAGKNGDPCASGSVRRGKLIIRWEIFVPTSSSSSKWESFKQMLRFGK
ncbi:hypothetical protein AX15_002430 [Amanita polypyramis BW_CC]|nr:hypothetical protein AX15_002430 [Amanita polypyramis BW_CC]